MANQAVIARQAHESAAFGSGSEILAVASVDQNTHCFSNVGLMNFKRNAVLHIAELVEAAVFFLLRRGVFHFGRRGSAAGREDEGEKCVVADLFNEADGVFKLFLRLAGEANDHIARQNEVRHDLPAIVDEL